MWSYNNTIENKVLFFLKLISYVLVAEQNNEFLMKNHKSRPNGSTPFSKVNAARYNKNNNECGGVHG